MTILSTLPVPKTNPIIELTPDKTSLKLTSGVPQNVLVVPPYPIPSLQSPKLQTDDNHRYSTKKIQSYSAIFK